MFPCRDNIIEMDDMRCFSWLEVRCVHSASQGVGPDEDRAPDASSNVRWVMMIS